MRPILALALASLLAPAVRAQGVEFTFEGNEAFSSETLGAAIQVEARRYAERDHLPAALDDAAFLLARHYRLAGYLKTSVSYGTREGDPRRVVFRIEEGEIWRYRRPIRIRLSEEVPGFRAWWSDRVDYQLPAFLAEPPIFVEDLLLDEIELAKEWIRERGYAQVAAKPTVVELAGAPVVEVDVAVALGPRTLVGAIEFAGRPLVPGAVLLAAMDVDPWPVEPMPYHADLRLQHHASLVRFYREKGYFAPSVRIDEAEIVDLDRDQKRAYLSYTIEPGQTYRIGRIGVTGQEHVSESTIRTAFVVEPGEIYNERRLEEGRESLYRMEAFELVSVAEAAAPDRPGEVDLTITVREKMLYNIVLSLGYSLFEKVRAGAEFRVNSLFGTGRRLDVSGHVSYRTRRAELMLVDPLPLGDTWNELRVGPFVERLDRESFTLHRVGGEFDFTRDLGEDVHLRLGWTYEFSDLRHLSRGLEGTGEDDQFFSGPRLGFEWERVDEALDPTRGVALGWNVGSSWKGFGATDDWISAAFRARFYYPLEIFETRGVVLHLSMGGDVVQPILGGDRVPIQKRLFLGGEDSIRSFEEDRLGPQNFLDTPIGGELSLFATFEARVQIWEDLWGVAFVDVGTVEERIEDFPRRDPDWGIGVGLRYRTPLGPLRLEIAFNPDRDVSAEEDQFEVVFTVGFRF